MDIINTIKEWFAGIFGEATNSVAENLGVDQIQQSAADVTQNVSDIAGQAGDQVVEQAENILPRR